MSQQEQQQQQQSKASALEELLSSARVDAEKRVSDLSHLLEAEIDIHAETGSFRKYDNVSTGCVVNNALDATCLNIIKSCNPSTDSKNCASFLLQNKDQPFLKKLASGATDVYTARIILNLVLSLRWKKNSVKRNATKRSESLHKSGARLSALKFLLQILATNDNTSNDANEQKSTMIEDYNDSIEGNLTRIDDNKTNQELTALMEVEKNTFTELKAKQLATKSEWKPMGILVLAPVDEWRTSLTGDELKSFDSLYNDSTFRSIFDTIFGICKTYPEILNPGFLFEEGGPSSNPSCPGGDDPYDIKFSKAGCSLNVRAVQNCVDNATANMVNLRTRYYNAARGANVSPLLSILNGKPSSGSVSIPIGLSMRTPAFMTTHQGGAPVAVDYIAPITYPELKQTWNNAQLIAQMQNVNIDNIKALIDKELDTHRKREIKSATLAIVLNELAKELQNKTKAYGDFDDYLTDDVFAKLYNKFKDSLTKSYKSAAKCASATNSVLNEVVGNLTITIGK